MLINPPDAEPTILPDRIGELLFETVKRSEHVIPALQSAVARYVEYQTTPQRFVMKTPDEELDDAIINAHNALFNIKTSETVAPDEVRFDHPDGRSETHKLGGQG